MSTSYIPSPDGKFSNWAIAFKDTVKKSPETYGVSTEQLAELEAEIAEFEAEYHDSIQQKDAAKAATASKDQARKKAESTLRSIGQQIQANPAVSDAEKLDAGLPVHKTSRKKSPAPTSVPAAEVEITAPLKQTVHFYDSENSRRKTKPDGVKFCEVVVFVGVDAPSSIDQFRNVGITGKSSLDVSFHEFEVGKTAYYRFRWTNPRGLPGPWSSDFSATVAQ